MGSACYFDFAAFYTQGLVQWDWLQIFHGHFARQCNHVAQLIHLSHGIVEDAGDDAAVAMAGRPGIPLAQAEAADEGLAMLVQNEFQAHAVPIVHAADEAVILLHFDVAGVVALGLRRHEDDSNLTPGPLLSLTRIRYGGPMLNALLPVSVGETVVRDQFVFADLILR